MTGPVHTPKGSSDLEARLRAKAPQPPDELVAGVGARVRTRAAGLSPARAAAASVTSLALVAALALAGGLDYAAAAVRDAAEAVVRVAGPQPDPIVVRGLSAGGDQYRPGYGWGDPNHNHTGPPGLRRRDAAPGPIPAARSREGLANVVATTVSFSEQAHLYISVVDPRGRFLLLTQSSRRGGSKVGTGLTGPQTKFIRYSLKVPRAITMSLRVPANLLRRGAVHRIRIVAVDPDGNRSALFIPFRP